MRSAEYVRGFRAALDLLYLTGADSFQDAQFEAALAHPDEPWGDPETTDSAVANAEPTTPEVPAECTGYFEHLPQIDTRPEVWAVKHDGDTCPVHEAVAVDA